MIHLYVPTKSMNWNHSKWLLYGKWTKRKYWLEFSGTSHKFYFSTERFENLGGRWPIVSTKTSTRTSENWWRCHFHLTKQSVRSMFPRLGMQAAADPLMDLVDYIKCFDVSHILFKSRRRRETTWRRRRIDLETYVGQNCINIIYNLLRCDTSPSRFANVSKSIRLRLQVDSPTSPSRCVFSLWKVCVTNSIGEATWRHSRIDLESRRIDLGK